MDVELYVYDLSGGMARQFSMGLIGQQIDAIYHTSVVFNNVEYFFGQGIHRKIPGTTHHGRPMKVVKLGKTQLSFDVIEEYLESLEAIYTPESYDLFVHNCNNFSQDFSMFLVGKSIPDEIRSLPETFLRTPMGQMLRGQIDQSMRTMTQAPDAVSGQNARPKQVNGVVNGSRKTIPLAKSTFINAAKPVQQSASGQVYNITSMSAFNNLMSRSAKSSTVVFFTSATCPPCKILYPTFDELASTTSEDKCIFIKVDVSQAQEIGSRYSIRATPTLMTFLKGQKLDEWKGADNAALRGNVRLLLQMVSPQHRHSNLDCRTFHHVVESPITFTKVPPLDKLLVKLGSSNASDQSIQTLVSHIKTREEDGMANAALPDLNKLTQSISVIYATLSSDVQFALVDLVRIAAADSRVSSFLTTNPNLLTTLLSHESWSTAPYNLRLVTCQLACNLFTSNVFQESLSTPSNKVHDLIEELAAACVVGDQGKPIVKQAAAALVYNLASLNHNERVSGREDSFIVSEDVEAAVVSAVYEEAENRETLHALLLALGLLLFGGSEGNTTEGLCEAMEISEVLKAKAAVTVFKGEPLLSEIRAMLARK